MGFLTNKCSNCGADVKKGDQFCTACGRPAPGSVRTCQGCGMEVETGWNYCGHCRREVRLDKPVFRNNIWSKARDEFAVRVETHDVQGLFRKDLIIEPNTKAIFIVDGRVDGMVGAGKYDVGGLFKRIATLGAAKRTVVLVVDEHDIELPITMTGVYTADPVGLTFECALELRVDDALLFATSQMKDRSSFTVNDLRALVYDELKWHFDAAVRTRTVLDLGNTVALREGFELSIAGALKQTLLKTGLAFVRLKIISCHHDRLDKARGIMEENYLLITEEEARLQGKRRFFDAVANEQELEELRQQEVKLRNLERRSDIWNRWAQAVNTAEMDHVRNGDELEAFLFKTARDKEARELIGSDKITELRQTIAISDVNRELALSHLRRKIELEGEQELEWIKAIGDQKRGEAVDMSALEHDLAKRAKAFAAAMEEERQKIRFARERQDDDDERDMKVMRGLVDVKAKKDEEKRKHEEESRRIDREDTEKRLAADHARQLEMIEAMSHASGEALIAMSGPAQAALVADLKKTEVLKGCSEGQILSMAAQHSPTVAQAFVEKFKAEASADRLAQMQAVYERMIEVQKAAGDDTARMQQTYAQMMVEMFEKGMDTQRDTASAAASRGGASVIYPPSGGAPSTVDAAGRVSGGAVVICPQCRSRAAETDTYCGNCGKKLRE